MKFLFILLVLVFNVLRAQHISFLKGSNTTGTFESLYDCVEAHDGSLYFVSNSTVSKNDSSNTWSSYFFKTDKNGNFIKGKFLYSTDTFSIFQNIFIKSDSIILLGRIGDSSGYYLTTRYYNAQLGLLGNHNARIPFPNSNYYIWQYKVRQYEDRSGYYGSGIIDTGNHSIRFPLLTPFYTKHNTNEELTFFNNNLSLIQKNNGAFANNIIEYKSGYLGKMRQYNVIDVAGQWERPPVANSNRLYVYDSLFNLTDSINIEYSDSISKPQMGLYTRRWCYMNQPLYYGTSFNRFGNDILFVATGDSGNCNSCSQSAYHASDFLQLVILDSLGKLKDKRGVVFDGYRECYKNAGYFPAMIPAVYKSIDIGTNRNILIGGYSSYWGNGNEREQGDGVIDASSNHIIIASLDSNYTPKWKKIFGLDYHYTLLSIKATNDGGVLALCCRYDTANYFSTDGKIHFNTDLFAYKLSAEGNITSVISMNPEKPVVSVYPNPGNEFFQLDGVPEAAGKLALYDLSGKLCHTYNVENLKAFPTIQLNPGMYIYHLTNTLGDVIATGKWIKE